jgi:membrane protease YdiL (CAAX protease family)
MMNRQTTSSFHAWRNVLVIILLSCLIIGLPNFVILTRYLPTVTDARSGAGWFLTIYAVCVIVVVGLILVWLRSTNLSLADLGWGKPTSLLAIVLGIVFGLAWLSLSLFGASHALKGKAGISLTEINLFRLAIALLGVIISAGEEIIMRGFVMNELNRAAVPVWLQIIISGLGFALYHSVGNFSLQSLIPSFVFSAVLAVIFVVGRRSLTPSIIGHGIVNFFGEPYLAMMILTVYAR